MEGHISFISGIFAAIQLPLELSYSLHSAKRSQETTEIGERAVSMYPCAILLQPVRMDCIRTKQHCTDLMIKIKKHRRKGKSTKAK
jgi:hypothetical protein